MKLRLEFAADESVLINLENFNFNLDF